MVRRGGKSTTFLIKVKKNVLLIPNQDCPYERIFNQAYLRL